MRGPGSIKEYRKVFHVHILASCGVPWKNCLCYIRDMNTLRYMVMLGVCSVVALVSAQITFSRDWTGGKRAAPHAPRIALDCEQFTRLCRHFVHDLKQAFSSEVGKSGDVAEKPLLYDDE